MARTLTKEHRTAISESLKEHHARKRRGKTLIGRIANRLTKTKKQKREANRNGRRMQVQRINAHIKDIRDELTKLRGDMQKVKGNANAENRRKQLKKRAYVLQEDIKELKMQRQHLRGK